MAAKKSNLGQIAEAILAVKMQEKALNSQLEILAKERYELEEKLRIAAEKEGLTKGGTGDSSWTINIETVPQVKERDLFYRYLLDNEALHLLQCRPAVKACREMWDNGEQIPGIEKFSKPKVTVKGT